MDYNVNDHVTKVIRYHPKYFEHYMKTHKYLMYDDGPLPFATRHFLAIIAAARLVFYFVEFFVSFLCIYLIKFTETNAITWLIFMNESLFPRVVMRNGSMD